MKNLANCTPVEFLRQTNKIRHSVQSWLKNTNILEVRKKNKPQLIAITENMTEDEKAKVIESNKAIAREQAMSNISDMLDIALDTYAEQTLEVLALMCFVEPEHINDHKVTAYIKEFGEMIADEDILDFFTSLMRLEQTGILGQSKQ